MKTREKINLALTKSLRMNRAGSNGYYTPAHVEAEGLNDSRIVWNRKSEIFRKLINTVKGWRGNYEHTAYIQVCE